MSKFFPNVDDSISPTSNERSDIEDDTNSSKELSLSKSSYVPYVSPMSLPSNESKTYDSLYFVPKLRNVMSEIEEQITDMLDLISEFYDAEDVQASETRPSLSLDSEHYTRRKQIVGDLIDNDVGSTRVNVVLKSETTRYNILSILKKHFLFSQLSDYELDDVIDSMQYAYAPIDEVIIRQGDDGDVFYILEEGACAITIDGGYVGELTEGTYFGDLALMFNCPRAATITATRVFFKQAMIRSSSNQIEQLTLFLYKIPLFEELSQISINQLAKSMTKEHYFDGHYIIRQGEMGEKFYIIFKGEVIVTSNKMYEALTLSQQNPSQNLYSKVKSSLKTISSDSLKVNATANSTATQSHSDSNAVRCLSPTAPRISEYETYLTTLREGNVFGERAIMKREPRAANVIAKGNVTCYYLDAQNFQLILSDIVEKMNEMNEFRLLKSSNAFNSNSDHDINQSDSILTDDEIMSFYKKHTRRHVYYESEKVVCDKDLLILIIDGKLVSVSGAIYTMGMMIGDLIHGAANIIHAGYISVLTTEVTVLVMNRLEVIHYIDEMKSNHIQRGHQHIYDNQNQVRSSSITRRLSSSSVSLSPTHSKSRRKSSISINSTNFRDLKIIKKIGQGSFGVVYVALKISTRQHVAIKCLSKKDIKQSKRHEYVRREVLALNSIRHHFIAEYFGVIVSSNKVLLMMEYVHGHDLWSMLYDRHIPVKKGLFGGLPLKLAAQYFVMAILAVEAIHEAGFIYRDLKPENFLMTTQGFLKLVDFGFAKRVPYPSSSGTVTYRTFTLCGTPEYMAPETILTQGHDKSVDFWALGILLFELHFRYTPFQCSTTSRTFEKIVHSRKHLSFPQIKAFKFQMKSNPDSSNMKLKSDSNQNYHSLVKSLIRRLLHPNSALRLGVLSEGIDEIKSHAMFTSHEQFGIDWNHYHEATYHDLVMDYIPRIDDSELSPQDQSSLVLNSEARTSPPSNSSTQHISSVSNNSIPVQSKVPFSNTKAETNPFRFLNTNSNPSGYRNALKFNRNDEDLSELSNEIETYANEAAIGETDGQLDLNLSYTRSRCETDIDFFESLQKLGQCDDD